MTPLALEIIIHAHIRQGQPFAPSERGAAEMLALADIGLITGVPEAPRLTKIGQVWFERLLATPLPGDEPEGQKASIVPGVTQDEIDAAARKVIAGDTKPPETPAIVNPPMPPGEGFTAVAVAERLTSGLPTALQRDSFIQVLHRDMRFGKGARVGIRPDVGYAGQFNFRQTGSDDDVIGWRHAQEPENKGSLKTAKG